MSTLEFGTTKLDRTKRLAEKSQLQLAFARFGHNRLAIFALGLMALLIFSAVAAPLLAHYDPIKQAISIRLKPPSVAHWLGTDALGRDNLSRILYGGRISLYVGFSSMLLSLFLGVPLGLVAGYVGGFWDGLIMRIMDLILAFPGIIFAIWLVAMIGPGVSQVILANALFTLPEYSRVVRGTVLTLKDTDYVAAARAMGASPLQVMWKHILPNVLAPVIIISSLSISGAILTGASLSFLGLGAKPPSPEWGVMLADGRPFIRQAWWLTVFPGFMLTLVVLASNIVGDGLRDALDPRATRKHLGG
jgi:peptide/nickel transport system permease protein